MRRIHAELWPRGDQLKRGLRGGGAGRAGRVHLMRAERGLVRYDECCHAERAVGVGRRRAESGRVEADIDGLAGREATALRADDTAGDALGAGGVRIGPTSDGGGVGFSSTPGVTVKFVALVAPPPIDAVMAMGPLGAVSGTSTSIQEVEWTRQRALTPPTVTPLVKRRLEPWTAISVRPGPLLGEKSVIVAPLA